jgi:hypothetical protein
MMNTGKPALIIGGVVFLATAAWYAVMVLGGENIAPGAGTGGGDADAIAHLDDEKTGVSAAELAGFPRESTLWVGTPKGGVQVRNFYTDSIALVEADQVVFRRTVAYSISYNRSNSSFWVIVAQPPAKEAREAGEAELLAALHVSKEDACKLDVSVVIPVPVDAKLGGVHRLSFCEGSAYYIEKPPEW